MRDNNSEITTVLPADSRLTWRVIRPETMTSGVDPLAKGVLSQQNSFYRYHKHLWRCGAKRSCFNLNECLELLYNER